MAKLREPYGDYVACREGLRVLEDELMRLNALAGPDNIYADDISKLSMKIMEIRELKAEAIKQYNARVDKVEASLEKARYRASIDDASGCLSSFCDVLEAVINVEKIDETEEDS